MMRIILGQEIDGNAYRVFSDGEAETGTVTAGTAGFLDTLELRMGIPEKKNSFLRVFQYERALRDAITEASFYGSSFRNDPYGAADTLVKSRDEILLSAPSSFSLSPDVFKEGRLKTLAEVEEKFLALNPDPGVPDRIRTVLCELRKNRIRPGIDEIVLADSLASWHVLFRELIHELGISGTRVSEFQPPYTPGTGDLGVVQEYLAGGRGSGKPPARDGSLLLVRGSGVHETADYLAVLTAPHLERKERVLLVDQGSTDEPAGAYIRKGLPSPGHCTESTGLPLLEVLPLYLALQFSPADPGNVLEYLSLPWSPVPRERKRKLLEEFIRVPGLDSLRLERTMEEISVPPGRAPRTKPLRSDNFWLSFESVREGEELPARTADEICLAFLDLIRKERSRTHDDDIKEKLDAAILQAELYRNIIRLRSWKGLTRHLVSILRRDTVRAFIRKSNHPAEAGSPYRIPSPAAALSPADVLVYWNFTETSVPVPARNIFTPEERRALEPFGVEFLTPESLYDGHLKAVIRALSCAGKRVLLVCPEREDGEPVNPHPLWYRMIKAFSGENKPEECITLKSSSWLSGIGSDILAGAFIRESPEPVMSGRQVFFQQSTSRLEDVPLPATFSPSRLQSFLGCPLSYVLMYPAGIEPARTSLPDGGLLYGKIAHDVIEECLSADRSLSDPGVMGARLASAAENYIRRSASVLAFEGMDKEREWVTHRVVAGGTALASALAKDGYEIFEIEKSVRKNFGSYMLEGYPDLIVKKKETGKKAVIDLKWSREDDFRDLLSRGLNLQTAVYSCLLGSVPSAYFIIETGRFVTVHRGLFSGADTVEGPVEDEVWNLASGFIEERMRALSEGRIEVGDPEKRWKEKLKNGIRRFFSPAPCRFCSNRIFCGEEAE